MSDEAFTQLEDLCLNEVSSIELTILYKYYSLSKLNLNLIKKLFLYLTFMKIIKKTKFIFNSTLNNTDSQLSNLKHIKSYSFYEKSLFEIEEKEILGFKQLHNIVESYLNQLIFPFTKQYSKSHEWKSYEINHFIKKVLCQYTSIEFSYETLKSIMIMNKKYKNLSTNFISFDYISLYFIFKYLFYISFFIEYVINLIVILKKDSMSSNDTEDNNRVGSYIITSKFTNCLKEVCSQLKVMNDKEEENTSLVENDDINWFYMILYKNINSNSEKGVYTNDELIYEVIRIIGERVL